MLKLDLQEGSRAKVDHHELASRAGQYLSKSPRPFLRWAGSKRALLPELVGALPQHYRHYYEPFLGGGSLFFLLQPRWANLGDLCKDLVETYLAVRDKPSAVLRYLQPLLPDREKYYAVRARRSQGPYKRAAEFIYLNKTCWNGLYRVNSQGMFNVPYGAPKTPNVVDAENLQACAEALASPGVSLTCSDFSETLDAVDKGDLVFLDPPYVTRHNNNGFIDYNERLFSWEDQERLADHARTAVRNGASVIVMNAYHQEVLDLYDGFRCREVRRSSTIASFSGARGSVGEAIIWKHGSEAA